MEKTSYEKRITALQEKLEREKAKAAKAFREARQRELMAWGQMVEAAYMAQTEQGQRETIISQAKKYLKGRPLEIALAGFARLDLAGVQERKPNNDNGKTRVEV